MKLSPPALAALTAAAVLGGAARPACAAAPKADVQGVSDGELRQHIQQAVGDSRAAARNRVEARRRAEDAAEAAALALRSEGYYDYAITPDVSDGKPPKGVLKIDPGPQFKIAAPAITWMGLAPSAPVAAAAFQALNLKPGQAGRAADVIAAEGRIVAELKKHGYADAKADVRTVTADYATHTLTPDFRIDSGSLVTLDGVRLVTKGRTRQRWVSHLAPWKEGQVYRPETVAELERRLNETGIYQSVSVALTPPPVGAPADTPRPVDVTLVDRAPINVQLGGSYSTSEGVGVASVIRFYNELGRADTLSLIANVGQIETLVGVQLSLPHAGRPDQTFLIEPAFYEDDTDAFNDIGERIQLTLKRRLRKSAYLTFGVTANSMRDTEWANGPAPGSTIQVTRDLTILNGYFGADIDKTDNPLNPIRGWKFDGSLQPTAITGEEGLFFVRALGQASTYHPFDLAGNTVLAARVRIGSILDSTVPDVPAPERFYSGGGGSVRGYTYQGIGPHFPNGAPEGGAGLFETSIELRQMLFGKWGMALFLDGGSLSRDAAPKITDIEWAAGIGARYYMGFGPIRADIGFPFDHTGGVPALQVYLGLGQAF